MKKMVLCQRFHVYLLATGRWKSRLDVPWQLQKIQNDCMLVAKKNRMAVFYAHWVKIAVFDGHWGKLAFFDARWVKLAFFDEHWVKLVFWDAHCIKTAVFDAHWIKMAVCDAHWTKLAVFDAHLIQMAVLDAHKKWWGRVGTWKRHSDDWVSSDLRNLLVFQRQRVHLTLEFLKKKNGTFLTDTRVGVKKLELAEPASFLN